MATTIHVVPDDSFDDWVVRGDVGHEFGHYATREDAEQVAQAIAQAREAELVVHLPDGRTNRKSFKKGVDSQITRKMIEPGRQASCHALAPSTCSRVHASN